MTVNGVWDTSAARQGQDKCVAQLLHRHIPAGALDVLRHLVTKPRTFNSQSDKVCCSLQWLVGVHTESPDATVACASITERELASCRCNCMQGVVLGLRMTHDCQEVQVIIALGTAF